MVFYMNNLLMIKQAASVFEQGGVIAYPTEAVFGLGCDPDNNVTVQKLLALKCRSPDKGLILLAANYSQLLPYLNDSAIKQDIRKHILSRWPGPITQALPANQNISLLLCGKFDSIAVRVTDHPDVVALCKLTGKPIVSTSANLSGELPTTNWQEVKNQFGNKIDFIIKSKTGGLLSPSTIINGITGEVLRG